MKGELFQMCSIIAAAKNALKTKSFIQYEPQKYELTTSFVCMPEKEGQKGEVLDSVESWFARCMYNGLEDIKFLMPAHVPNKRILGFVNTSRNVMVCFYPDKTTVWIPVWKFNKEKNGWNIIYQEDKWQAQGANQGRKPSYKDNSIFFEDVLKRIKSFAEEINEPGWADVFDRAIQMLGGDFDYAADDEKMIELLRERGEEIISKKHLDLPKKNLDMFEAAACADVFAGAGSWNDKPFNSAVEKERDKEYFMLSDELYFNLVYALSYAINEW